MRLPLARRVVGAGRSALDRQSPRSAPGLQHHCPPRRRAAARRHPSHPRFGGTGGELAWLLPHPRFARTGGEPGRSIRASADGREDGKGKGEERRRVEPGSSPGRAAARVGEVARAARRATEGACACSRGERPARDGWGMGPTPALRPLRDAIGVACRARMQASACTSIAPACPPGATRSRSISARACSPSCSWASARACRCR